MNISTAYNTILQRIKWCPNGAWANEQDLVVALRKGNAFIPELSFVAEIDKELAGHILFTKAKVNNDNVLVLAPLSVKPQYQKQGVGTALIVEGHKIAKELGYEYSLVLGSELCRRIWNVKFVLAGLYHFGVRRF